jgi:hypothetical protein
MVRSCSIGEKSGLGSTRPAGGFAAEELSLLKTGAKCGSRRRHKALSYAMIPFVRIPLTRNTLFSIMYKHSVRILVFFNDYGKYYGF